MRCELNKEICEKCVYVKDSEMHINSVCEDCYKIDSIGNGENSYFIEKIEEPECCGKCKHCLFMSESESITRQPFCNASGELNYYDRHIHKQYIRRNFLRKNTPQWCPMKQK